MIWKSGGGWATGSAIDIGMGLLGGDAQIKHIVHCGSLTKRAAVGSGSATWGWAKAVGWYVDFQRASRMRVFRIELELRE